MVGANGRMAGKIAFVTGAGFGFGRPMDVAHGILYPTCDAASVTMGSEPLIAGSQTRN